jgi:hypothetical protein
LKNKRFVTAPPTTADQPAAPRGGLVQAWTDFWFSPVNPVGLNTLRVLAGLLFLAWLLPLAGDYQALFSVDGWFDQEAYREAARLEGGTPAPINWSLLYVCGANAGLVSAFYWGSIAILVLFTLGLWTRVTSVLTWLIVVSFLANPAARYEADYLLVIVAFYLMIGYVLLGQWSRKLSLAARLLGTSDTWLLGRWLGPKATAPAAPAKESYAANLAVRLFQVHFALVVVTAGLHKLQHGDWWAGVAFWYPLHPPFETTADSIRAEAPSAESTLFMLSLAQYLVLAWQLAFPAFAWRRRWRVVLLGGAVVGWLGSIFLYQLPLFGPVFVLGCLSYLTAAEWLWAARLLSQGVQLATGAARPAPDQKIKLGARS